MKKVEFGRLKRWLVFMIGLTTPVVAGGLLLASIPPAIIFTALCVQSGCQALFVYLLQPAAEEQKILDGLEKKAP
jgi:multisubunit Na+/H+ antiporter MnhC subunit